MSATTNMPMGLGCSDLSRATNAIIGHAITQGVTLFDTADCYGENYESEIALGAALSEAFKIHDRSFFTICSKVGVKFTAEGIELNGTQRYIAAGCRAALERLQLSYIDIYYLHRLDPNTPFETSIRALKQLVEEGLIKKIGLSEVTADQIRRAHRIHPVGAVQIEYSPWSREDETNGVFETCKELGIQIVGYSPLGRGLFTQCDQAYFDSLPEQDYRKLLPRYTEHLEANIKAKDLLQEYAKQKGWTLAQLSLAWAMKNGCSPIPATLSKEHLDENMQALKISLTDLEMMEIGDLLMKCEFVGPRYPNPETSAIFPEKRVEMALPVVDDLSSLSENTLREIKRTGFFYVAIPGQKRAITLTALTHLQEHALKFFRDPAIKNQYPVDQQTFVGYVDHKKDGEKQLVEQLYFRPNEPACGFEPLAAELREVYECFHNTIALPLIKRVLESCGLAHKFEGLTHNTFSSISFPYYPSSTDPSITRGIKQHKDFDLITVLWVTKPGLEVFHQGEWTSVDPKEGYLVVNFANALELVLGGAILNSALHRVRIPDEERLSIGLFVSPSMDKPLCNLFSGEVLFEDYSQYIRDQFTKVYYTPDAPAPSMEAGQSVRAAESVIDTFKPASRDSLPMFTATAESDRAHATISPSNALSFKDLMEKAAAPITHHTAAENLSKNP